MFLSPLFSCNNQKTDKQSINSKDKIAVYEQEVKKKEKWDSIIHSDEETDFTKYIHADLINKKQKNKTKYGKEEIIYLGEIKEKDGTVISHVVTVFGEVQATIEIHGHSQIVFIRNNLKQKKDYYLNGQEELPFKLENNNLYFHNIAPDTNKETVYIDTIGIELPWLICFGPNTCN